MLNKIDGRYYAELLQKPYTLVIKGAKDTVLDKHENLQTVHRLALKAQAKTLTTEYTENGVDFEYSFNVYTMKRGEYLAVMTITSSHGWASETPIEGLMKETTKFVTDGDLDSARPRVRYVYNQPKHNGVVSLFLRKDTINKRYELTGGIVGTRVDLEGMQQVHEATEWAVNEMEAINIYLDKHAK